MLPGEQSLGLLFFSRKYTLISTFQEANQAFSWHIQGHRVMVPFINEQGNENSYPLCQESATSYSEYLGK